jgi:hypothetical protein
MEKTEPNKRMLDARAVKFAQLIALGRCTQHEAIKQAYGKHTSSGSERTYRGACRHAQTLLANPKVKAIIEQLRHEYGQQSTVRADELTRADLAAGFFHPAVLFERTSDGQLRTVDPDKLPPEVAGVVKKITVKVRQLRGSGTDDVVDEIKEITYEISDPIKARESAAKRLGLDQPERPLEQLLAALSPDLRGKVWAELAPLIQAKG